jgi:RNA polymerase sigma-70 factor (ECF subfamily)
MYAIETLKDERTLVLRLIDGDEEAFCELYAAYKNRLIYFAMRFLKSRDYAEDVFQDAFTVIWQGRRFINPDTSFSSYLYTIVRNRILNQLRNLEKEENLRDYILSQAVDYSDDTRQHILANDLRNLISSAMHQLTDRQREIFEMSREEQMSHREIAEALGISVSTVQEHISSSLRILRSYLKKYVVTYADLVLLLICLRF